MGGFGVGVGRGAVGGIVGLHRRRCVCGACVCEWVRPCVSLCLCTCCASVLKSFCACPHVVPRPCLSVPVCARVRVRVVCVCACARARLHERVSGRLRAACAVARVS